MTSLLIACRCAKTSFRMSEREGGDEGSAEERAAGSRVGRFKDARIDVQDSSSARISSSADLAAGAIVRSKEERLAQNSVLDSLCWTR